MNDDFTVSSGALRFKDKFIRNSKYTFYTFCSETAQKKHQLIPTENNDVSQKKKNTKHQQVHQH